MCTQPGLDRLGELDHVAGALDVGDPLGLGVGGHVVDRREVEEVVDVAVQALEVLVGDAEPRLGEVADDADDAVLVDAPAVAQLLEAPLGALADEHVDRPLALEQLLDQVAADEAGRAGDEVAHLGSALLFREWASSSHPTPAIAASPTSSSDAPARARRSAGAAPGRATGSRCSRGARWSARDCALPISPPPRIRPRAELRCGFCDHAAPGSRVRPRRRSSTRSPTRSMVVARR